MTLVVLAGVVTLLVALMLGFGRFANSETWRATVTPLASIIGSGFLICGPLLASEFGSAAVGAMAVLLAVAYAVGAVIRFNIRHYEPFSKSASANDPIIWLARAGQATLAVAYAVSVAYYLKLLAEFVLKYIPVTGPEHLFVANLLVTVIILVLAALVYGGGMLRVERVAHSTVAIKLGVIAGMLAALAGWWWLNRGSTPAPPPMKISLNSIGILLGLLITVQGFETSRYMGEEYSADVRIRTMKHAQWISSAIYLAFMVLLTPFLARAAASQGVAGIVDIMAIMGSALGVLVLVGALSAQLSAAVADSIGSSGLMHELSRRVLSVKWAYSLTSLLSIAIVWATDPFQVIAVSSRAFALFYAVQCLLAFTVARRTGVGTLPRYAGFILIGLLCALAAAIGAPAE